MADLRSTRSSLYLRNAALTALKADFAGGKIKVYSGLQVATPETAPSGILLVTMTIDVIGTISVAGGVLTCSSIISAAAVGAGTAQSFRVTNAADTQVLWDGVVGNNTDGDTDNLELPSDVIAVGMVVGATSLTYTLPMQGV